MVLFSYIFLIWCQKKPSAKCFEENYPAKNNQSVSSCAAFFRISIRYSNLHLKKLCVFIMRFHVMEIFESKLLAEHCSLAQMAHLFVLNKNIVYHANSYLNHFLKRPFYWPLKPKWHVSYQFFFQFFPSKVYRRLEQVINLYSIYISTEPSK